MNVTDAPGRIRGQFRSISAQLSNRSRISIDDVQVQENAGPNNRIPWSFTVRNNANVNVLDPDWCPDVNFPAPSDAGARLSISVRFAGERDDRPGVCISEGGGEREFTGSFFAPSEPGDYTFQVIVEGNNSGNRLGSASQTVTVEQSGPQRGGCPDGFVIDPTTGNCIRGNDGNGNMPGQASVLTALINNLPAVIGLILVLFLLSTLSNVTG